MDDGDNDDWWWWRWWRWWWWWYWYDDDDDSDDVDGDIDVDDDDDNVGGDIDDTDDVDGDDCDDDWGCGDGGSDENIHTNLQDLDGELVRMRRVSLQSNAIAFGGQQVIYQPCLAGFLLVIVVQVRLFS